MEVLNLLDQALWTLDQARRIEPDNMRINRRLAQVLEKTGNFAQAMILWEMVRKANPTDLEAQHKAKDLAASDTIARGNYLDVLQGNAKSPAGIKMEDGGRRAEDGGGKTEEGASAPEERGAKDIAILLDKIQALPKVAANYLHLASIHRRNENIDKARDALKRGLAPTGNDFDIVMELLDLEIEPFRRDLRIAESKLRNQPDDAHLQKICAQLFKEINTRELDYHRKKADRYPTEIIHRFEMGVRLLAVDQVDEAIKELQVVRNDPQTSPSGPVPSRLLFQAAQQLAAGPAQLRRGLAKSRPGETEMRKELLYQLANGLAEAGDMERAYELGCELANLDYSLQGDRPACWTSGKNVDMGRLRLSCRMGRERLLGAL